MFDFTGSVFGCLFLTFIHCIVALPLTFTHPQFLPYCLVLYYLFNFVPSCLPHPCGCATYLTNMNCFARITPHTTPPPFCLPFFCALLHSTHLVWFILQAHYIGFPLYRLLLLLLRFSPTPHTDLPVDVAWSRALRWRDGVPYLLRAAHTPFTTPTFPQLPTLYGVLFCAGSAFYTMPAPHTPHTTVRACDILFPALHHALPCAFCSGWDRIGIGRFCTDTLYTLRYPSQPRAHLAAGGNVAFPGRATGDFQTQP